MKNHKNTIANQMTCFFKENLLFGFGDGVRQKVRLLMTKPMTMSLNEKLFNALEKKGCPICTILSDQEFILLVEFQAQIDEKT